MELSQRYRYVVARDKLLNIAICLAAGLLLLSVLAGRSAGLADKPQTSAPTQPLFEATTINIPAKYTPLKSLPVNKPLDKVVASDKSTSTSTANPAKPTELQATSSDSSVSQQSNRTTKRQTTVKRVERQMDNLLNRLFKNLR